MPKFDFLVVGGGIAGLTYALEVAPHGSVAVLFKKGISESSTAWAQGGIAAVSDPSDDVNLHIEDTLRCGVGLCHRDTVEVVVREGPERVQHLIDLGINFDRQGDGYHLHQEGGHSRRRIFHAADATGSEIQKILLARAKEHPNIQFYTHAHAVDLITSRTVRSSTDGRSAYGAYVLLENGEIDIFLANKILLATGGAGKVYRYTSNPDVATGDGIAIAYRAGARVANLEFFQFHPTCLYHPKAKSFLITEAMRGEGAKLKRIDGSPFMQRYHPQAELAPRDVVARAIDSELKASGDDYVLLDITHRPADFVREHFPNIYERCKQFGIDITSEPIPVVPAAHYCCGGVISDLHGRTDIQNLYVAGECAHTGLHGANRLASNSLLEGVVFGYRAARDSIATKNADVAVNAPPWDSGDAVDSDEQVVISQNWDEIRRCMWNYVGIVRSDRRLERALSRSQMIEQEIRDYYWNFTVTPNLLELRNLSLVANLVIRCAIARKESRGLHYNIDHLSTLEQLAIDTIVEPNIS